MSDFLYIDRRGVRLKSYGSTSRGAKATVRVELEVTDPMSLGHLLQDLAEIAAEQAPEKPESQKARKRPGPLLLTHRENDE